MEINVALEGDPEDGLDCAGGGGGGSYDGNDGSPINQPQSPKLVNPEFGTFCSVFPNFTLVLPDFPCDESSFIFVDDFFWKASK
jgi:hypothetical protein